MPNENEQRVSVGSDPSPNVTASAPNAWLLCLDGQVSFDGFSVRVLNSGADLHEGDGVVLADRAGSVLTTFGRVYRTRVAKGSITIHLDAILKLDSPVDASATDVVMPPDGQSVSRLEWSTFENALRTTAGTDFASLPVITGSTQAEQAYLRDLLQLATMDDLLGPACGPEETIVGMSVRDRYLVGKLAPKEEAEIENIEGLQGLTAPKGGDAETPDASELTPFEEVGSGPKKGARRRLPGEEFAGTAGSHDPDSDDRQEVDASRNQSLVPSSMGITVCVDGDIDTLELDVRWGRYERRSDLDEEEEYERKNKAGQTEKAVKRHAAWKRIPSGGHCEPAADRRGYQVDHGRCRLPAGPGPGRYSSTAFLWRPSDYAVPDQRPDQAGAEPG